MLPLIVKARNDNDISSNCELVILGMWNVFDVSLTWKTRVYMIKSYNVQLYFRGYLTWSWDNDKNDKSFEIIACAWFLICILILNTYS